MLTINVLGSMQVLEEAADLTPTADKPRRLLALLALNHGRTSSVAELAEELWGQCPPKAWKTTVQTYIVQLRKLLGDQERLDLSGRYEFLSTRPGGYVLHLADEMLDVDRFTALYRAGLQAAAAGDDHASVHALAEALRLCRGPALEDMKLGSQLSIEAVRLSELRLAAIEAFCDGELRLGRHGEVLVDLAGHVARHPTHEALCALYMRALHQADRRVQALTAFRDLDRALRRELGLSPSIPLQRLYQAILTEDPALCQAVTWPRPAAQVPPRPRRAARSAWPTGSR